MSSVPFVHSPKGTTHTHTHLRPQSGCHHVLAQLLTAQVKHAWRCRTPGHKNRDHLPAGLTIVTSQLHLAGLGKQLHALLNAPHNHLAGERWPTSVPLLQLGPRLGPHQLVVIVLRLCARGTIAKNDGVTTTCGQGRAGVPTQVPALGLCVGEQSLPQPHLRHSNLPLPSPEPTRTLTTPLRRAKGRLSSWMSELLMAAGGTPDDTVPSPSAM